MRHMRRFSLSLITLVFLAGCGGGSTADATCESSYWDDTIGTCVPEGWHVVDEEQLDDRGVPDEVVVAFQSDTPFSGQFPTVTVTRETLPRSMTSAEYSEASVLSVQALPNYDEIDKKTVAVDKEDVELHIFTAQPREDQPVTRFYQVSAVSEGIGYTFTAATPVSVNGDLDAQIRLILSNATFTEPEGE